MSKFWGKVIHGKKRGKNLGFPTANIRLHKKIPEGVYISTARIKGCNYKAVSFVGAAKTFDEKQIFLETHIFDFKKDIYGQWLSVRLQKKLRGNKKFETVKQLIIQINEDKKNALQYFAENKNY